jgi:hypothetical protein
MRPSSLSPSHLTVNKVGLAGADGQIAFHDVTTGKLIKTIVPVPIEVSAR